MKSHRVSNHRPYTPPKNTDMFSSQIQLIQCREGAQDQRNIAAILRMAATALGGGDRKRKRGDEEEESEEEEETHEEGGGGKEGDSKTGDLQQKKKMKRKRMNLVRGSRQYVYTEDGDRFLDCTSSVAHVGHCHPRITGAFTETLNMSLYWDHNNITGSDNETDRERSHKNGYRGDFIEKFQKLLPQQLSEVIVVNSGSQANGLAIQLAQAITGGEDVIVFESSFHGSLCTTSEISTVTKESAESSPWVRVLPVPDTYRSTLSSQDYLSDAVSMINEWVSKGAKISCLLMEPIFTFHGMTIADPDYIQGLVRYIRSLGALVILDEVQGGLGRTGSTWAFQHLGFIPDILTSGKPLSNGFPFGVMATSPSITSYLNKGLRQTIEEEGVDCRPSLAVLEVVEQERLIQNVQRVGALLHELLRDLLQRRKHVGQITGKGFMVGIDLVVDKKSREPCPSLASWVVVRSRDRKVLMAREGKHRNVVYLMPSLCFTELDTIEVVRCLDTVLAEAEQLGLKNLEDVQEAESEKRYFQTVTEETESEYADMD